MSVMAGAKPFQVIPAIDLMSGTCVRLTRGDFSSAISYGDPLEMARRFEDAGLERLHLVDLDGAREGTVVNRGVLEAISVRTKLIVDFGGGVRSDEAVGVAFGCGAHFVTLGSIVVKNPEKAARWIENWGADRFILGADVAGESVAIDGWRERSSARVMPLIRRFGKLGISRAICTDIERDGMLEGPSFELYERLVREAPGYDVIASGGVASVGDLERLRDIGVSGAIVGKAYYESRISLREIEALQRGAE